MNTSWDNLLSRDLRQQAALYPKYDFRFHDTAVTVQEQAGQIEDAIRRHPDVIIVSPSDEDTILPLIEKAYDAGIPVVLVGQRLHTYKYTALIGCNDSELGRQAFNEVRSMLPDGGNILILGTDPERSLAGFPRNYIERSSSFSHSLKTQPDIHVLAEYDSGADKESAHAWMDSLKTSLGNTDVDMIFSYGYGMLKGAFESMNWPDAKYICIEGLSGESIQDIISGDVDAVFVTPTGGSEAINTSISIISGVNYTKDKFLEPFFIDSSNAEAYQQLLSTIVHNGSKIDNLSVAAKDFKKKLHIMRILNLLVLALFILASATIFVLVKHHKGTKDRFFALTKTNSELETLNKDLAIRCEVSERISRMLESEKKTILDVVNESPAPASKDPVSSAVFMNRFRNIVNESIGDSDLSVETVASRMNMSRAQLFRRVKADTGMSPNEMILEIRLNKAREFFTNTDLSVSEVAYSTGFASPSYFSKCFKDRFGVSPTESKK